MEWGKGGYYISVITFKKIIITHALLLLSLLETFILQKRKADTLVIGTLKIPQIDKMNVINM